VSPANSQGQDLAEQVIAAMERGPVEELLGGLNQSGNGGYAARSNLYFPLGALTDGALAATGVGAVVPVPVAAGDVITAVNVPIGATAGATMTHQFAAVYSAVSATAASNLLLAQSTDTTSAAIAASALASWTLATPVTVTKANAPFGFLYVMVAITASTIPTAAAAGTPTGINYQWVNQTAAKSPIVWSGTAGSAVGGTAPANLTGLAAKAVAPVVILT
jgi:hypothetical protein